MAINEVDTYTIGQKGLRLSGRLREADGDTPTDMSLDGWFILYIKFIKPNGLIIEYACEPADPSDLEHTDIIFDDSDVEESVLDITGIWHYTFGVQYGDGDKYESPVRQSFVVV